MIALDLLTRALRLAGVSSPGQPVSSDDAQVALDALNDLLEDWSTQSLAVFTPVDAIYSFVAGQQVYSIGPTAGAGNFVGVRPIQVQGIYLRYQSIDYQIREISNSDFNDIPYKAQQGPIPLVYSYDGTYPNGTISFWPIPNQVLPLTVTANQQLTNIPTINTTIAYPPAYVRALRYNLAVDLCSEYDRDVPPNVADRATRSLASIKRANITLQEASFDPALTNGGTGYSRLASFIAGF